MLQAVLSDNSVLKVFKPKKYVSRLYAVHALYDLNHFEFLIYRGKIIMRLPELRFKIELPNGKWKYYRQGLDALCAVEYYSALAKSKKQQRRSASKAMQTANA